MASHSVDDKRFLLGRVTLLVQCGSCYGLEHLRARRGSASTGQPGDSGRAIGSSVQRWTSALTYASGLM